MKAKKHDGAWSDDGAIEPNCRDQLDSITMGDAILKIEQKSKSQELASETNAQKPNSASGAAC